VPAVGGILGDAQRAPIEQFDHGFDRGAQIGRRRLRRQFRARFVGLLDDLLELLGSLGRSCEVGRS
jgi:hypothetical protein